jgi:hypothetical protein
MNKYSTNVPLSQKQFHIAVFFFSESVPSSFLHGFGGLFAGKVFKIFFLGSFDEEEMRVEKAQKERIIYRYRQSL